MKNALFKYLLAGATWLVVAIVMVLVGTLTLKTAEFFGHTEALSFFGTVWLPDQNKFGLWPLLSGTVLVAGLTLLISLPLSLCSALAIAYHIPKKAQSSLCRFLEICAGIPTIVFGFVALITIVPFVQSTCYKLGLACASENALVAAIALSFMILPFTISLMVSTFTHFPKNIWKGSLALGATPSETIFYILLPACWPTLIAIALLAFARVIGETMIVSLLVGLQAHLSLNPLQPNTTLTTQILTLMGGDQAADSPKTLVVFALGLVLFGLTLIINRYALRQLNRGL
jgi:phosphate transport system permease protein